MPDLQEEKKPILNQIDDLIAERLSGLVLPQMCPLASAEIPFEWTCRVKFRVQKEKRNA